MEPLRETINDYAVNSNCHDQVFNGIIKQENIIVIEHQLLNGFIKQEYSDETDHNNESQLLQIENTCKPEREDTTCIKIKTERDIIERNTFEGTLFKENHSSEFIGKTFKIEREDTTYNKIKTEKDVIEENEFEGTLLKEYHSSELYNHPVRRCP
ncbi:uncharacterized protein LOC100168535 isoform X2 [Acyrthosiphon pisum]|uniref:Uncharacterized protein n=1 Tax=Acyrthosiphon pisum TaxID=7029 RepID=A0A8R2NVK8_ACYPI|nr:uncharacterized protein LOC100168535 isoform X2 [Acyrthosiphon pisum]